MPDKKLTDSEIVNALECCALQKQHCPTSCPLSDDYKCEKTLFTSTLDLINCLQAEKSDLEIELKAMRCAANSYKAENKTLSTLAELGNKRADDYRVMRDRALKAEAENERLKGIKTTDWLIKGISKEQLQEEKIQALTEELNRLEAENEQLKKDKKNLAYSLANAVGKKMTAKVKAYKEVEEKISGTTWYHINKNGKLVKGANSETDIPLYKAEDIFNLLKELVGE